MSQLRARFRFLLLPAIAAASMLLAVELVGNLYFVWKHGVFFYGSRAVAEEVAAEESIPGSGEIYSLTPYTGFRIRPGVRLLRYLDQDGTGQETLRAKVGGAKLPRWADLAPTLVSYATECGKGNAGIRGIHAFLRGLELIIQGLFLSDGM